jgi:hypothetical protein
MVSLPFIMDRLRIVPLVGLGAGWVQTSKRIAVNDDAEFKETSFGGVRLELFAHSEAVTDAALVAACGKGDADARAIVQARRRARLRQGGVPNRSCSKCRGPLFLAGRSPLRGRRYGRSRQRLSRFPDILSERRSPGGDPRHVRLAPAATRPSRCRRRRVRSRAKKPGRIGSEKGSPFNAWLESQLLHAHTDYAFTFVDFHKPPFDRRDSGYMDNEAMLRHQAKLFHDYLYGPFAKTAGR